MKTKNVVTYANFQIAEIVFRIEGTEPLIVHKFSDKAKKMIEDKQAKKSKGGRAERDPESEMKGGLHLMKNGKYGFPTGGFKAAMVRAGKQLEYTMTDLKGWFFIEPDCKETNLVEIIGEPELKTDMVRIGNGVADVRYRPVFNQWAAAIKIRYNNKCISAEQIAEILALAGFSCGIGDWRPEKSATGNFGKWKLV